MNDQFMLTDLALIAVSLLAFCLVGLVPGYVLAWFLDLLDFRRKRLLARLTIAVPVSIGVCPILHYLLGRFLAPAVWVFYGACAIAFVILMFRERRELPLLSRRDFVYLAIAGGWLIVGALALCDLQWGHRLYFPTVTYDYSVRVPLTSSITRAGIPAHNPFFFPGRLYVMHYHYFWFILCSAAEQIGGSIVGARHAVDAGTIWCGLGLLALVPLYLRFFPGDGSRNIRRRTLLSVSLLAVTGLDILPVVFIEIMSHGYFGDFEWWNEQVSAWIVTVLWTPHHLAGLIACLTGFLLIWSARPRNSIATAVVAGLMFASSAGMTIHVTLVFAVFLGIWMAMEFWRGHRKAAGRIALAGISAAVFALPFLGELLRQEQTSGGGVAASPAQFPFQLAVRSFRFFDSALGLAPTGWKTNLADFLALPLNYGLELGFFLIAGIVQCRRFWRSRRNLPDHQLCALTMAMSGIFICSFINSSVSGTSNDLGWRGFLPAQFILLLWGGEILAEGWPAPRRLIALTLVLGVAGSLYALAKVRFYPVLSDITSTPLYPWLSPDRRLGERTMALRRIYDQVRRGTPAGAIFQHNPNVIPEDLFNGIYADRQVAAGTMSCLVNYGGDAKLCQERIATIDDLFENPRVIEASRVDEICRRLSINVLLVKDTDKGWGDRESWIWKRTPTLANDYGRVFVCGNVQ